MIRCVFFDMDGVLINTEGLHYKIWKQIFAEHGVLVDYEHYKGCIGSNCDRLFDLIQEGYGKDFREVPGILEYFSKLKDAYIEEHGIPKIEGAEEIVLGLKEQGYHLAVVSSSPREAIEKMMTRTGLADSFEAFFSGAKIACPKPAPDIYLAAAEALQVKPEECVVIEDSENGSRAAKAAGMTCYGFRNPDSGDQDLSVADEILESLAELKGILLSK